MRVRCQTRPTTSCWRGSQRRSNGMIGPMTEASFPARFRRTRTPRRLTAFRAELPGRLPPLYERLILTYRWPEVWLRDFELLPNPEGEGLSGLLAEMRRDQGMWSELAPRGLVQFGRPPGLNYDPVCFDLGRRRKGGECPVVQLDHEAILCYSRIRQVAELAPSFRELVASACSGRSEQRCSPAAA
jgi:hypothetical protein